MRERIARLLGRRVRIRGVDRVLRAMYPCRRDAARYVCGVRPRNDGLAMELDTRTLIDWSLLFHGEWESNVGAMLSALLVRGATAADVGANVGAHTLTIARLVGTQGRVLAFEPNPAIHRRLTRNVALNQLRQVELYDCALGARNDRLDLMVPAASSAEAANPGLASLVALDSPHDLVPVRVRPLDDVVAEAGLGRLDAVKMDVQGYERQVLCGMRNTIRTLAPAIIFEYEDWAWQRAGSRFEDVHQIFKEAKYVLWQITGKRHRLRTGSRPCLTSLADAAEPSPHADFVGLRSGDPRIRSLRRAFGGDDG